MHTQPTSWRSLLLQKQFKVFIWSEQYHIQIFIFFHTIKIIQSFTYQSYMVILFHYQIIYKESSFYLKNQSRLQLRTNILIYLFIMHIIIQDFNNQVSFQVVHRYQNRMLAKKTPSQIEEDIKKNKVKEGMIVKQSRFLKQWKQRFIVLTRTYLYSFEKKGVYKDPTEVIPLEKTLTVKSYYKMQYDKPHIFRIQTPDIHLYLSPKTSQEKWAWMTAIEKMLNRVFVPQQKNDSHDMIRETLKMRETMINSKNRASSQNQTQIIKEEIDNVMDKLKLGISCQTVNILLQSPRKKQEKQNQAHGSSKKQQKIQSGLQKVQVQKIVEKQIIVHMPVQKQKIVEKIVYVPQVRQKIIEKVVYRDQNLLENKNYLQGIFRDLIDSKVQNPKPMVNFITFLVSSRLQKYTQTIIKFLTSPDIQRFFAQIFLHLLNQETDQQILNIYWQFATIIYQNCNQYFYSSDVRVLIDIVLKEMELNRSEFNQFLLMSFVMKLSIKDWWKKTTHRRDELKNMVRELESISNTENQTLAKQLQSHL